VAYAPGAGVFEFRLGGRDGPKEFLGPVCSICRPTAMALDHVADQRSSMGCCPLEKDVFEAAKLTPATSRHRIVAGSTNCSIDALAPHRTSTSPHAMRYAGAVQAVVRYPHGGEAPACFLPSSRWASGALHALALAKAHALLEYPSWN